MNARAARWAAAGFRRGLRFEPLEERRLLAITVNTLTDEADGSILDGDVSLRDAIAAAPAGETINFSVNGTITLALGNLTINKSLTLDGPGMERLRISGNNVSRVLLINNGDTSVNADVQLKHLTVADGRMSTGGSDQGGAILSLESLTLDDVAIVGSFAADDAGGLWAETAAGGQIAIRNSLITGNSANGAGGGAYVFSPVGGSLTIENSTFSYNQGGVTLSGPHGGGLQVKTNANSAAIISNSTFSGNTARSGGGGIGISQNRYSAITLTGLTISGNQASTGAGIRISANFFEDSITIAHSTITGNKATTTGSYAGGGIYSMFANLMLDHTIVAGNQGGTTGSDMRLRETTIAAQYSLVGINTGSGLSAAPVGSPDANGNLVGVAGAGTINARLAPLADIGGVTKAHALLADSPALDAGNPAFVGPPNFDQRGTGFARVVDGDGVGGARIDMGAFERQSVAAAGSLIVTTTTDEMNGDLSAGDLSLREAIGLANASAGTVQTISFAPSLAGSAIRLNRGTLQITDSTVLNGLGADLIAIEGIGYSRVMSIDDGNAAALSLTEIRDVTIRGGNSRAIALDTSDGGGIRSVENLVLERSKISGNVSARNGGGVYVLGAAGNSTTIDANTFSDNQSTQHGGGLALGTSGTAAVRRNVFTSNTAVRNGGALLGAALANGNLTIEDSKISGNDAVGGGGAYLLAVSAGQLTFARGSVYDNLATAVAGPSQRGGGGITIGVSSSAVLSVIDSTISDNDAVLRGGAVEVVNTGGDLRLSGLTISGNRSRTDAGGVWAVAAGGGTNRIEHSTLTGNIADSDANGSGAGGGVFAGGGLLPISNTIVAGNLSNANGSDAGFSATGTLNSGAGVLDPHYSLVGNNTGSGLIAAPVGSPDAKGNLIGGVGAASINPLLGALADNGGTTKTHLLLAGSPAIDAGDPAFAAPPANEQRGFPFPRVFDGDGAGGARIDMGAVEKLSSNVQSAVFGDYNRNNAVDAADYVLWRKQQGTTGVPAFAGADGSGNGGVGSEDFAVWRAGFGRSVPAAGTSTQGEAWNVDGALAEPVAPQARRVGASGKVTVAAVSDDALVAWLTWSSDRRYYAAESSKFESVRAADFVDDAAEQVSLDKALEGFVAAAF